ncbi:MAG: phytanoyl-CoA dioxygenase [Acidimicrobiaceae bacterium]|nr:phytanoyl-CoA dioxygenase [Acidimicrobiaceae bacterium]
MLTDAQLGQFQDEGYVVLSDVIPEAIISDILQELGEIAVSLVEREKERKPTLDAMAGRDPFARLIGLSGQTGKIYSQYFDMSFPTGVAVADDVPINTGPSLFAFLTHTALLDCVERIIGPEISSNPVQHVRLKLPEGTLPENVTNSLVGTVPWHQDNGVTTADADEANILTVWAPLTPATIESGCLEVIPRSHRQDLLRHCSCPEGYAIPKRVISSLGGSPATPLEMQPGSVLFMHKRTIHSSFPNQTADQLRISLDLRYNPIGQATGRSLFPDFVARSRRDPELELRDPARWSELWQTARRRLQAGVDPSDFFRWGANDEMCA